MKLDMQLKKEIALNKVLKKQRAELRKMGRAQDLRKKEMAKISKVASETMHDSIFIQPIPSQLPLSHTIEEPSQLPLSHTIEESSQLPLSHTIEESSQLPLSHTIEEPSQLPLSHTIEEPSQPVPQHDSSQNTIAIPLIHSLENNHPEIEYSVSGMIREDAIDTIPL